jgi:diguanylate cyclase (GGDEF)-like protein
MNLERGMDWTKIPDVLAMSALVVAFYSILRREPQHNDELPGTPLADSRQWLFSWILILIHFIASMVVIQNNLGGSLVLAVTLISLVVAAVEFMRASVPYRGHISSRWMTAALGIPPSIYILLLVLPNVPNWLPVATASVIAIGPLMVGLLAPRHLLGISRYVAMTMYLLLGISLLIFGPPRTEDASFAMNAILFTVYFCCCLIFWVNYKGRSSAGSVITVGGFLAWALVFVIGPILQTKFPAIHIEGEVWNLPKYVVAVGMLLLLLENQIERSQYLALHDDLTTLANRRKFQSYLSDSIERCSQSEKKIALLQIDLDRFKQVNDAHGHHVGDLLLQQVADRMRSRIRRGDLIARTGGDEFSVILADLERAEDVMAVADSLLELLKQPFSLDHLKLKIGASIGSAIYPDDANDASNLYIVADLRMYQEKELSRGIST